MNNTTRLRLLPTALLLSLWCVSPSFGASRIDPDYAVQNPTPGDGSMSLQPWSEALFTQVETEYGSDAAKRMRYLYELIQANRDKPVREKLELVNSTLNLFPWVADKDEWDEDNYWATPLETLAKFGGDCEDMAIGKFVMLRLMGVPKKNLYLGYVKIRATGEAHMVLVWLNDARNESLVLDNYDKELKSGKERPDLLAIFLFDADENVILLNDDNGARSIKEEIGHRKMSKLQAVKQRILENNEKYSKYNDGRPLWIRN